MGKEKGETMSYKYASVLAEDRLQELLRENQDLTNSVYNENSIARRSCAFQVFKLVVDSEVNLDDAAETTNKILDELFPCT